MKIELKLYEWFSVKDEVGFFVIKKIVEAV